MYFLIQFCLIFLFGRCNPAPYYSNIFKDIYHYKTQQWFSDKANNNDTALLHHMSGWSYLTQEKWNDLCSHVLHNVNVKNISNIFDAGCGCGSLFKYVSNINNDIKLYGCDINIDVVRKCKQIFPLSDVSLNTITKLNNYNSNSFDLVTSISTISYLYNLNDVFLSVNELIRIAKSNACICICVNTDNNKSLKSFNIIIPKHFWSIFKVKKK